nr:MAG: ORF1 [TTV-like mini virus]
MPYYWKRRYYRNRTFWRRRTGGTFRRRRWRRPKYRRRLWVRRRRTKRKLLTIKLKQYQPKKIRNCKIVGDICLFQGSPLRSIFNYTQYMYSFVPPEEPGGGGYGVIVMSLGSLFEGFQHLKNIWTTSNTGLPLVRYLGATFYFYQSPTTDYAVEIRRDFPMNDFKYTHADSCPNRMLLKTNTIKVPSTETRKKRKPYKKVKIKPPAQLENKWYFQKDICDLPLVMILATAVDLRYHYGGSHWESNNISLICLNPLLFQDHNFTNYEITRGYYPKPNLYLYASRTNHQPTVEADTAGLKLIYLGNTKEYKLGQELDIDNIKTSSHDKWGNPFYPKFDQESYTIYGAPVPPSQINKSNPKTTFTIIADNFYHHIRYNPEKDTGETNQLYVVPNYDQSSWEPPENQNLVFSGLPFFDIIWGYVDWQEKVHDINHIMENHILVMKSKTFNEPLPAYIPIDLSFRDGFSPYRTEDSEIKITDYDKSHWHPCIRHQVYSMNQIGLTGTGCCRSKYNNYLQAKMKYIFKFKWGGSPKDLEKPFDPCSQPKWDLPSNLSQGIQIENPSTAPETQIQSFDWNRDYIKQKTISRIQKHTKTDGSLQLVTEHRFNPPAPQESSSETSESSSEEEETQTSLQTQILRLRKQQLKLKRTILHRLTTQNLE